MLNELDGMLCARGFRRRIFLAGVNRDLNQRDGTLLPILMPQLHQEQLKPHPEHISDNVRHLA